jgi:hypothetical protein
MMYKRKTYYRDNKYYNPNNALKFLFLSLTLNIGSILIIYLTYGLESSTAIDILGTLCLIQFVTSISFLFLIEKTFFSFTSIFYIISNLFHLGQLTLISLDIEIEGISYVIDSIDVLIFLKSCTYVFICHMFYILGVLTNVIFGKKVNFNNNNNINNEYGLVDNLWILKKIGWIFIFIGIFPKAYIDINKLILFINGAYINTYNFAVSGYISLIASLSEYGILILLIAYQKNKSFCNKLFILAILYQSIIIYSGNRGKAIIFIILLIFIYTKVVKKISIKSFIFMCVFGYIGLITINVIGDTRSLLNRDWETMLYFINKNTGLYPIWRILGEFGSSLITVAYSLEYFPDYAPVQFGLNYLLSFTLIFPNIVGSFSLIFEKIQYVKHFPFGKSSYLGGSYIGETYYSFNIIGPAFVLFIGIFISSVSKRITQYIKCENWIGLVFTLVIFSNFLWWNRDFFGSMIRDFFWINGLIFILIQLIKKKSLYQFKKR